MEHATLYTLIILVTSMSGITWSYRRNRPMQRVQRCLRSYIGRAA